MELKKIKDKLIPAKVEPILYLLSYGSHIFS